MDVSFICSLLNIYIYVYIYICVCVCVRVLADYFNLFCSPSSTTGILKMFPSLGPAVMRPS